MELFPLLFFEHLSGNFIALALCRNFLHETPSSPADLYVWSIYRNNPWSNCVWNSPLSFFFDSNFVWKSPSFFAIFPALIWAHIQNPLVTQMINLINPNRGVLPVRGWAIIIVGIISKSGHQPQLILQIWPPPNIKFYPFRDLYYQK